MTRHRARPSFTVEVKRTRNNLTALADETTDRTRAAQALWKGTALAEMTERASQLDEVFAPPAPRPAPRAQVASKPVGPERRVLPSLIPAPTPAEPAPEPAIALAPIRAPRQRSTAPRRRTLALLDAAPAAPRDEVPIELPREPVEPTLAEPVARDGDDVRERTRRPALARGKDALRPGERWKRRLPRVCW